MTEYQEKRIQELLPALTHDEAANVIQELRAIAGWRLKGKRQKVYHIYRPKQISLI